MHERIRRAVETAIYSKLGVPRDRNPLLDAMIDEIVEDVMLAVSITFRDGVSDLVTFSPRPF